MAVLLFVEVTLKKLRENNPKGGPSYGF